VKSDCFAINSVINITTLILARILSTNLMWQHEYAQISTFYIIDALTWLGSIKICKMEFERELKTDLGCRIFWGVSFAVAVIKIIQPWEFTVGNFWLNLCRLLSNGVLATYAVYIPKDTNDNFIRAEFEQFMPRRLFWIINFLEEYVSGRDLSAEMQVELGSVSSLEEPLVDVDAEKHSRISDLTISCSASGYTGCKDRYSAKDICRFLQAKTYRFTFENHHHTLW
jgi:hypothetical protein